MSASSLYLIPYLRNDTARMTLAGTIRLWWERSRTRARDRAALAWVTDFDLHDLGMTRSSLAFEVGKPFWRA